MPERKKKKSLKSRAKHAAGTKKAMSRAKTKTAVRAAGKESAKAKKKPVAAKGSALPVFDLKGHKLSESVELDPMFLDNDINQDVIYQAIVMYQAGQREGTASTKDRGHVRGGGKKPWKQKGTGQARHGSRRSPIWRGGGTTFGPMPRDYSYAIPSKLRRRAVLETLKDKVQKDKLVFVKGFELDSPKTKGMVTALEALKLEKPLLVVDRKSDNLMLASRNLPSVSIKFAQEINALDVASHKECVVAKEAYSGLLKRLKS